MEENTEDLFTLLHALELITKAIRDEVDLGYGQGACYVIVDGAKELVNSYNSAILSGEIDNGTL